VFISKSNALTGRTPSVSTGVGTDLPSNMSSPDFSLSYTASGSRIVINYGGVAQIDYIAICASNFVGGAGSRITVRDGTTRAGYESIRGQYTAERPHVCMFNFERQSFSELIIVIDSESASKKPTIHYIAGGQAIQVPNGGEVSGYARQWLTRGVETRTQGNELAAPIASLRKRVGLTGSISIPNMRNSFVRDEWQQFLDFASVQPFFMCEQENLVTIRDNDEEAGRGDGYLPEASYMCYNPKFSAPKAHSDTRALQNLQLRFDCYNGL
jgi:hypothetical protein